jgi:L-cysteine/cystine lyase
LGNSSHFLDDAGNILLELRDPYWSSLRGRIRIIKTKGTSFAFAVERARAALPVVEKKLYFNTGWSGPSPKCVVEEQKRVLEWLACEGVSHHIYKRMSKNIERLRSRLASFLNAHPHEIALTRGTTEAINMVLGGIDWKRGEKVVTTNIEHGAALIPVYHLRDRYGVDVEIVNLDGARHPIRAIMRALDGRTRMVVASHVSFNTGLRLPLKELSAAVSERGAELLVDGAQSVGAFRINLGECGCDYYAFPGHKWMLGPDAVGGLFVRKEKLRGLKLNFAGNESARTFDRKGKVTYHRTAKKFEYADFNAALVAGWLKALDFIDQFGMDTIEAAIRENSAYLKRRLSQVRKVRVVTPQNWERSAGLVSIAIEGKDSERAFRDLLARGIVARYTPPPSYIRFSVNFFNTQLELDRLIEAVKQISIA